MPRYAVGTKVIERKICYDSTIVEHDCVFLKENKQNIILFHKINESFTMESNHHKLTIPKGSYTLAYYWKERPYNLYIWRDENGNYLGAYFNIVKNTYHSNGIVSFEDLIIDLLVLPDGELCVLDENELPLPLEQFESGFVYEALESLTNSINQLIPQVLSETESNYKHNQLISILNQQ